MACEDTFATYHPLVNFLFYIGALVGGMFFLHPAFVLCAVFFAALHYRIVKGRAAWHFLSGLLPLFIVLTVVNPVFNTYGDRVLFVWHIGSLISERPYTTEALLYGMALGGMFVSALLWFASYNVEMTEDKFLYLFGRFSPSVSLVLTMVLRLVPNYQKKAGQLMAARRGIGKGTEEGSTSEKVGHGLTVLSALLSWALEGGIATADSMRSRGYGCGRKRTSFSIYRFESRDRLLLGGMVVLLLVLGVCAFAGGTQAEYTPVLSVAGPENFYTIAGVVAYALFLAIPAGINLTEELKWHILRSKI